MIRSVPSIVVVALLVGACTSGGSPSPASPTSVTATAGPATPPAATTIAGETPVATSHPGAGVPDPDGRIAFGRITGDDQFYGQVIAIWAIDPDGSDEIQLNGGGSGFPAWSPDGSRLAFTQRQADGTWQIATMAPDGEWIIYDVSPVLGGPVPNDQVERIAADGSGSPKVLFPATDQQGGFKPSYSPDGSRILFGCFLGGQASSDAACLMDADGANVRILVNSGQHENHFSWGPPVPQGG